MSQAQLIQTLNGEAREGDCVIAAAGSPPGDLHRLWDVTGGAACYLEFGYSCMGWELPAGLGTRMAGKHDEVYVYIGDGTYLMNPTELMTAMQEGLKVTVVISENHGYQIIPGASDGPGGPIVRQRVPRARHRFRPPGRGVSGDRFRGQRQEFRRAGRGT